MIKVISIILVFAVLMIVGCTPIEERNVSVTENPVELSPLQQVKELAALTENDDGVDNEWALWLINAYNPLPPNYAPSLTSIGVYYLDSRAAQYAILMIMAARNDGITLIPISAYRSTELQSYNFRNYYSAVLNRGYSPEQAFYHTASRIAVPGTSEHNAGLAIDFNLIAERFDQTEEFRWLQYNAHNFGFILRYPRDTTDITGIIYEPWHFRFVGLYHARRIYNSGLTLEEYIGFCAGDDSVFNDFKRQILSQ